MFTLTLLAACSRSDADADDALGVLLDVVLAGIGEDEVVVHEVGRLAAGTRVAPAFGASTELTAATTLFLVDPTPDAAWQHDVDWVWIDDAGTPRVEAGSWWPVVDGEPFVPEWHAPVWGGPYEWYDPVDFDEDEELARWGTSGGTFRAAPDPCDPPRPKVAVTIAGGRMRAMREDELNWRDLLAARGYHVVSVTVDPPPSTTTTTNVTSVPLDEVGRGEVLDAIRAAVGTGDLEELVIVWTTHGERGTGTIRLGEHGEGEAITQADLVAELHGLEADRLVLVDGTCYAGVVAEQLPAALKDAGLEATDIVVHAATQADEKAWVDGAYPWGSGFQRRLHAEVAATPRDEPIPWHALAVDSFVATTRQGGAVQVPVRTELDRCVPEITLDTHPALGTCFAAWLDQLDPAAFTPFQDYDRGVLIRGKGFGETGTVELQREDGAWAAVPATYWSEDGVAFQLPMRRDGFPANGRSPGVPGDLVDPADQQALAGTYLVRVVTPEGAWSPPQPIKLEYQIYEQQWTPILDGDEFPEWVELWHPLTPSSAGTAGPTIQLSTTWNASREPSPLLGVVTPLDADDDQEHLTSVLVRGVGEWGYEIPASVLDPTTAYVDVDPAFRYWGFRAAFANDDVDDDHWGFTLIYD